jgi:hypothetical protein
MMKPEIGGEAMSHALAGPSGVVGDSAQGKISRGTWETRQSGERERDPNGPREYITEGRFWPGVGEAHSSAEVR